MLYLHLQSSIVQKKQLFSKLDRYYIVMKWPYESKDSAYNYITRPKLRFIAIYKWIFEIISNHIKYEGIYVIKINPKNNTFSDFWILNFFRIVDHFVHLGVSVKVYKVHNGQKFWKKSKFRKIRKNCLLNYVTSN